MVVWVLADNPSRGFYRPASGKVHSFRGGMKASRFLHN
ncbi:hypothetical protein BJQ97_02551 [Geobacillus sp. TFV-3]|nr:hypothetical protein BJQ97_02551 [Geobacillus sp. TFV-3]